jgi:hypothetical protein
MTVESFWLLTLRQLKNANLAIIRIRFWMSIVTRATWVKIIISCINFDEHKRHIKMETNMMFDTKWPSHMGFDNPSQNKAKKSWEQIKAKERPKHIEGVKRKYSRDS